MNTAEHIQQVLDRIYKEDYCPKAVQVTKNKLQIHLFWLATKKDLDLINTIVGKEYTYIGFRHDCFGAGVTLCYHEEIDEDILYDMNRQYNDPLN